ncbi:hypothetical protein [Reinekea thalattae]|uniref:Guanylate cyclase domain-containing protein n=1 Tax=Reinekea thalattae TaxID=2593301 RepID=A0A5C8ZBA5_9GAMM|nr:hypothetical protein [Reinekea thalattae]TXR54176.1 hypothetical protein FME95_06475 [Reinekea thalattae]
MLLLVNLMLYSVWYKPVTENLASTFNQQGEALVNDLAFQATPILHNNNRVALSALLNRVSERENVILASVTFEPKADQATADTLSSKEKPTDQTGIGFQKPIEFSHERLGYAEILLSHDFLMRWKQRAAYSAALFNSLIILGFGLFIYSNHQRQQGQWQQLSGNLHALLPKLAKQLTGSPEQQLKQLFQQLNDPLNQQGEVIRYLQNNPFVTTDRLIEQISLGDDSRYLNVALVSVECQNWEQLIRSYDANQLQHIWQRYESMLIQVGELYDGVILANGLTLAFGLADSDEQYAVNALYAAKVIELAHQKIAQSLKAKAPEFGIAVSTGPAFVSQTLKHGLPLPVVAGDAEAQLAQIRALQPRNQILISEPLLQFKEVNNRVEANLARDITLHNGDRLEVWELDDIKGQSSLLDKQAQVLVETGLHS